MFLNRDDCIAGHGCLVHELQHALDWMSERGGLSVVEPGIDGKEDPAERRALTMEQIYGCAMLWLKRQDRRLKA